MSRNVLLSDSYVRIFHRLMTPITHQRAPWLSIILVAQVSIIDGEVIPSIQRLSDPPDPAPRFEINIGELALGQRRFDRLLKICLDLFKVFRHVDLF